MKTAFKPYLLIGICTSLIIACNNNDDLPELPEAQANFAIGRMCSVTELIPDSINYIDSVFKFTNLSDTGQLITHHWNFGDGQSSTQYHTQHSYARSGYYTVSMVTRYDGTPRDTFSRGIHVIIGEERLMAGEKYTWAEDVAPADNNGMMVLVQSFENFSDPPEYCLISVDSTFKQQVVKRISGSFTKLNSLQRLSDGNYVAAGNYAQVLGHVFSVSKINPQGNEIWTKSFLPGMAAIAEYAAGTSDGGILAIGDVTYVSPSGGSWFHTVLVKLDANGNEVWKKLYNTMPETDFMSDPINFVEVNGDYYFGSIKRNSPSDSIIVTRINALGNTIKRTATAFNSPSNVGSVGIAKAGNSVVAFLTNTRTLAFYGENLDFIKYQEVSESGIIDVEGRDNKFYIIEGTFQYSYLRAVNTDGTESWQHLLGGWIRLPSCSGLLSGASRRANAVLLTPFGDVVGLTQGQDDPNSVNSSSSYLYRYTESGVIR